MKKILLLIIFSAVIMAESVAYIQDSILHKDENYITLLGGSVWKLSYPSLALTADDVMIVFHKVAQKNKKPAIVPVMYSNGEEVPVWYVSGNITPQSGYLTTVMSANSTGSILTTVEGYKIKIPEYDQYDTGFWLPPYRVILTSNQMYMWNLREGKRVWTEGVYR